MTKKALVVWGGMEQHTPERGADVVRQLLEEEGFAVSVTPDYEALGAEDVGSNDLVVPVITDGTLAPDKMANLIAAIRAGTGLAGYHMGLATTFRASVPFRYAVVSADQVEASHFADGRVNPAFSQDVIGTLKALNNGRTAGVRASYEMGAAGTYRAELERDASNLGIEPALTLVSPACHQQGINDDNPDGYQEDVFEPPEARGPRFIGIEVGSRGIHVW